MEVYCPTNKQKQVRQTFKTVLYSAISKSSYTQSSYTTLLYNGRLVLVLQHMSEIEHTHECLHWCFLDETIAKAVWYPTPPPPLSPLSHPRKGESLLCLFTSSLLVFHWHVFPFTSLREVQSSPRPLSFSKPWIMELRRSFLSLYLCKLMQSSLLFSTL